MFPLFLQIYPRKERGGGEKRAIKVYETISNISPSSCPKILSSSYPGIR
jgi:hypothetical protein